MSQFPKKPVDAFDIFDYAVRHHFGVFKKTWLFVILIAFVQAVIFYITHVVLYPYVDLAIEIIGAIALLFFMGSLLYKAQIYLEEGHDTSFSEAMQAMLKRCMAFFSGVILLILIVGLYYFLVLQLMHRWIHPVDMAYGSIKNTLIFIGVYMIPTLIFIVFMIFALPLTIVDRLNPLKAMARSYKLVGTRWLQAFTVYACIGVLYILVSPATLHAHFLIRYHLFMPFVLLMCLMFLPFICNYLLFMLNDFKLRFAAQVDF